MAAHTAKPGLSPSTVFTCMLRACTETRLTGTYRETSTALCTRRTACLSARLAARNSSSGRVCAITCSPGPAPDQLRSLRVQSEALMALASFRAKVQARITQAELPLQKRRSWHNDVPSAGSGRRITLKGQEPSAPSTRQSLGQRRPCLPEDVPELLSPNDQGSSLPLLSEDRV